MTDRLAEQLAFLVEVDRLKRVDRPNVLMDGSRFENAAEHSWHLALWAMIFADAAPEDTDLDRALMMCLLHDLVEIDGTEQSPDEATSVERLFALLPADQGASFHAVWTEFAEGKSPEARYVRMLDTLQPAFQELFNPDQTERDREILRHLLTIGRAALMRDDWPEAHDYAMSLLDRKGVSPPQPFGARLRFLAEADRLKTVLRGTTIFDGSRRENSAEHSWHLALYAIVLGEHSVTDSDPARALKMLILHDLVEIDAGDAPVHGNHDPALQEAKEQAAADRLFGMLPEDQGTNLRALWDEFEAAASDDAIFAKSVDRVQPVMANLECGGGSWIEYDVTIDRLEARVASKIRLGLPAVWEALRPAVEDWFSPEGKAPAE
ncbi:HD domain-containing protein [Pelagovum pacificum]|uniref:5'-deoxynucleotidase n=1 Tax=Pelagovum pacificum TaxID=2588711 RepID=A0A5C5GDW0_9RHOB|nr:HD domain-containing protein [Pelagovum pacificum]QQA44683.1 HD domain-containing protein [Pelagovum pacificum]TNY32207.1 HD domain-containing protein [Pelagovum pacificum]